MESLSIKVRKEYIDCICTFPANEYNQKVFRFSVYKDCLCDWLNMLDAVLQRKQFAVYPTETDHYNNEIRVLGDKVEFYLMYCSIDGSDCEELTFCVSAEQCIAPFQQIVKTLQECNMFRTVGSTYTIYS
jgi:hypothetical protein